MPSLEDLDYRLTVVEGNLASRASPDYSNRLVTEFLDLQTMVRRHDKMLNGKTALSNWLIPLLTSIVTAVIVALILKGF